MNKSKIDKEYIKKYQLDEEEIEILEAFESGKLKSVKNLEKQKKIAKEAAKNTLKELKNKSIHLKLRQSDLDAIRAKAKEEGIPYQTILGSLIHKFAAKIKKHDNHINLK